MAAVLIDSLGTAFFSSNPIGPNALHPSASASASAGGQTFQMPTSPAYDITSVKFYLKKTNSPTGNSYARLYAHTGTYGSTGEPTGSALASSAALDVSTVSTSQTLYEMTFATPYRATAGGLYVVTWEAPTSGTFDGSNYVETGANTTDSNHAGNLVYYASSEWQSYGFDLIFYLYGEAVPTGGSFLFNLI